MKNNDQWFEPGDKVVRVANIWGERTVWDGTSRAPFGKVFCVSYCLSFPSNNTVNFVGIQPSQGSSGFRAANFRKVEEIQLCVRAAEAIKNPKKQEEMA